MIRAFIGSSFCMAAMATQPHVGPLLGAAVWMVIGVPGFFLARAGFKKITASEAV